MEVLWVVCMKKMELRYWWENLENSLLVKLEAICT